MTSGLLFYWLSWLLWIYVTFIMKKEKRRTLYALWILLILTSSPISLTLLGYKLSLSFLLLIFGSIVMLGQTRRIFFNLFSSLTIMVLYLSIKVWETNLPIWMILSQTIIIPFLIVFVVLMITPGFYTRLSVTILGLCSAELLYSFILSSYTIQEQIGGYRFFDCILLILFIFIGIEVVHMCRVKVRSILHSYKKSLQVLTEK